MIVFTVTLFNLLICFSLTNSILSSSIPLSLSSFHKSRRVSSPTRPRTLPSSSQSSSKKSKWIVHLYPNCTHQHFASHLDDHIANLRSASLASSSHRSIQTPLIVHEYQHVLHGLTIQDIHEQDLQTIPCIKSYVRDSVKRLVSVPSWGIDRIDQENLPLDNKYETIYTGRDVDGTILTSISIILPSIYLRYWIGYKPC